MKTPTPPGFRPGQDGFQAGGQGRAGLAGRAGFKVRPPTPVTISRSAAAERITLVQESTVLTSHDSL